MKSIPLLAGIIISFLLISTVVDGKINEIRLSQKLDSNLMGKLNDPGEETVKVLVWVDKEKVDKRKITNAGEVTKEFNIIPAMAMEVKKSKLKTLASSDFVRKITIDHPVQAFRDDAIPLTRSALALNTFGYNGTNIKLAIIDTGIFNHTEFQTPNRIIMEKCFTQNNCPPDNSATSNNAIDDNGHGTHVAGIAAGVGGSYGRGSAPNVSIMAIKVLDSAGNGDDSDVVSAIE